MNLPLAGQLGHGRVKFQLQVLAFLPEGRQVLNNRFLFRRLTQKLAQLGIILFDLLLYRKEEQPEVYYPQ